MTEIDFWRRALDLKHSVNIVNYPLKLNIFSQFVSMKNEKLFFYNQSASIHQVGTE